MVRCSENMLLSDKKVYILAKSVCTILISIELIEIKRKNISTKPKTIPHPLITQIIQNHIFLLRRNSWSRLCSVNDYVLSSIYLQTLGPIWSLNTGVDKHATCRNVCFRLCLQRNSKSWVYWKMTSPDMNVILAKCTEKHRFF